MRSYRCFSMRGERMIQKLTGKKDRSSGSFGTMVMYQNYPKSGYAITKTMHTEGLKSFAHVLVRCFLLENIRQPYQKMNQTPTYILMSCRCLEIFPLKIRLHLKLRLKIKIRLQPKLKLRLKIKIYCISKVTIQVR